MIEFYEVYFTVESSEIKQEKGIRDSAAVGKYNVAIKSEPIPVEDLETRKNQIETDILKQMR